MALKDLPRTLVALPVSAWAYGRIVAVSASGPIALRDVEWMEQNRRDVASVLNSLNLEIDWWA